MATKKLTKKAQNEIAIREKALIEVWNMLTEKVNEYQDAIDASGSHGEKEYLRGKMLTHLIIRDDVDRMIRYPDPVEREEAKKRAKEIFGG